MSFGNAISMPLLSVLFVTGITGAVWSDAEEALYRVADVAHPEWYSNGMQLFAFEHAGPSWKWKKKDIYWALVRDSSTISRADAEQVIAAAFAKWAAVIPLKFHKVSRDQQSDIRVGFGETEQIAGVKVRPLIHAKRSSNGEVDDVGVDVTFHDIYNWVDMKRQNWRNLRFCALAGTGHALGLNKSKCTQAIMYGINRGPLLKNDPDLFDDDVLGVQALYGSRPALGPTTRTFTRMIPAPTGPKSFSSTTSSSSKDADSGTTLSGGSSDN